MTGWISDLGDAMIKSGKIGEDCRKDNYLEAKSKKMGKKKRASSHEPLASEYKKSLLAFPDFITFL